MKEMHCLQLLLLFFYMYDYSEGNDLDWNIVNKITDYGQNITLFCKINNCCQRNSGWDIFDPNRRTLWIDVRDVSVDSKAKYAPFTNEDGFGLIIRNVTKDDFGIRYGCAYGFDEGDPKMLTENLAFKDDADDNIDKEKDKISVVLIAVLVIIMWIITIIVVKYQRRLKDRRNELNHPQSMPLVQSDSGLLCEENNFIRIFSLCQKIGTESVRQYLDRQISPNMLDYSLKPNYAHLAGEIRILFQGPSSTSRSRDYDIPLLYSLIKNTLKTIPPPTQGWGIQPKAWDMTEEDDIERIHQYRNKLVHNTDFQISDTEFNLIWSDLTEAINRLSLRSLEPDISELKSQTFNCTYKAEVVQCIKDDIKQIQDGADIMKNDNLVFPEIICSAIEE